MNWFARFRPGSIVLDLGNYLALQEELAQLRTAKIQLQFNMASDAEAMGKLREIVNKLHNETSALTLENANLKAALTQQQAVTLDDIARRLHIPSSVAGMVDWERVGVQMPDAIRGKR